MKTIELNPQKQDGSTHSLGGKIFDTDSIKGAVYSDGVLLDLTVFPFTGGVFTHLLGDGNKPVVFIDASYDAIYAKMTNGTEGVVTITIEEN